MNCVLRLISIAADVALITCTMNCCAAAISVVVPCGVQTDYDIDTIANGTTYLLQNCTSDVGTALALWPSVTSISDIAVVVEHSRRVAVRIKGNAHVDLIGLHVSINNVTNDLDESKVPGSVVCPVSTGCIPLVSLVLVRNVVNSTVAVTNVLHQRNQSIIEVGNLSALQNMTLLTARITASGYGVALLESLNATLLRLTMSSTTASGYEGQLVFLFQVSMRQSTIMIYDTTCAAPQSALALEDSTAENSSIVVGQYVIPAVNAVSKIVWGVLILKNSTLDRSLIAIDHAVIVAGDNQAILVTAEAQSSLSGTKIVVNNCSVTGTLSRLTYFFEMLLSEVSITIHNATCTTQLSALPVVALLAPANAITIIITHSYIVAPYAVYLDSFNATTFTLVVDSSTLGIAKSSILTPPPYLAVFHCFNGSFADSNITMTSVRTTSDTPGFETGQMVQFQDFVLTNTTVSFFLTTLEGSGGIISVWRTIVDQSSTIRVEVAANITVASSFQSDIVDMYLVIISGRSSVEIILPKAIQRATGSAQYAALSIDTVSVIGSSALRIGSNFSVACKWPNNIMW
ncbi:Hypothetical protein, putative, partial [Bodo saltans]